MADLSILYSALNASCDIYEEELQRSCRAMEYLTGKGDKERGLEERTIQHFRIGFSPNSWCFLKNKLAVEQGYNEEDLFNAGLLSKMDEGNATIYSDTFRNRVMVPYIKRVRGKGQVIGYTARCFPGDQYEISSKYINSRSSEVFKKGEELFNFDEAAEHAEKEGFLVLYEAPISTISSWQNDVKNTTASSGTAITKKLFEVIRKRLPDQNIILCLDGDKPGRKATLKACEELMRYNFKIVELFDGYDPDDMIRKGIDIEKILAHQISAFDYLLEVRHKEVTDSSIVIRTEDKINLAKKMMPSILDVPFEERRVYVSELERRLDLKSGSLCGMAKMDRSANDLKKREYLIFEELAWNGFNPFDLDYINKLNILKRLRIAVPREIIKFFIENPHKVELLRRYNSLFNNESEVELVNGVIENAKKSDCFIERDEVMHQLRRAAFDIRRKNAGRHEDLDRKIADWAIDVKRDDEAEIFYSGKANVIDMLGKIGIKKENGKNNH